jgi:DNA-binding NarL/FixJ family response regulator
VNPLRVLIADDHPVFRDGIRALLETTPHTEVVGEAITGEEAVLLATELKPDLILMDVQMPGLNGIEATRRIVAAQPQIRVLVVTMFEDDASVFTAMRAGARGYVLKDATREEIRRAIQAVGNGEAIFSPAIAARLMAYFAAPRPAVASFSTGTSGEPSAAVPGPGVAVPLDCDRNASASAVRHGGFIVVSFLLKLVTQFVAKLCSRVSAFASSAVSPNSR